MSPNPDSVRLVLRCACVWLDVRCENAATAEDGLCNWCASLDARTEEQLRVDPKAIFTPDGEFHGIGGAGQLHDSPLAQRVGEQPAACWYPNSGRTIVDPARIDGSAGVS